MNRRSRRQCAPAVVCFCLLLYFLGTIFPLCVPAQAVSVQVKVAFAKNFPPFQFVEKNGTCVGLHVDLFNAIAQEHGWEVVYIPCETLEECERLYQSKEADVILGVPTKGQRWCSEPLSTSVLCTMAPNHMAKMLQSKDDYKRYTVAFELSTISYSYMYNMGLESFLAVGNQVQALERQLNGQADLVIGVRDSLLYQLHQRSLDNDYTIVRSYMGSLNYSLLAQEGNHELLNQVNESLIKLHANGRYDDIYSRWRREDRGPLALALKRITTLLCLAGLVGGGVLIINASINYTLKRKIGLITQELSDANRELGATVARLQDASNLRKRIIESSPSGMLLFDRSGSLTMVNRAACALSHNQKQELLGRSVQDIWPFNRLLEHFNAQLSSQSPQDFQANIHIATVLDAQGEKRSLRYNIFDVRELDDNRGRLMTVEDVTQEEKQNREMFEAEKSRTLNRIVASVAHEIRNPLMSIRTFAAMIKTNGNNEQFQQTFSQFVPVEVDRINNLIEQFINYTKPSAERPKVVRVREMIDQCMYLIRPVAKHSPICFTLEIDDTLLLEVDSDHMKQVLINMMMNSIQSMEKRIKTMGRNRFEPLEMQICARREAPYVVISIRDQGMGMSSEQIKHCLDPFYTTKATGTGLGLTLSCDYITRNGGELQIESEVLSYTKMTMKFLEKKE